MTLNDYQDLAIETDNYEKDLLGLSAHFLGLTGESGEAAEKAKKEIRDHAGQEFQDKVRNHAIMKELSDVLWYVATTAFRLGYSLQEVAQENLDKVYSRQERGMINGSGDDR